MRRHKLLWALCALVILLAGCGPAATPTPTANDSDLLGLTATARAVSAATGVSARPTVTAAPSDTPQAASTPPASSPQALSSAPASSPQALSSAPASSPQALSSAPETRPPIATPTDTPAPPTPTPQPLPPEVLKQGFGQQGRAVGVGLLVRNPNPGLALQMASYHITAYDAAGAGVGTAQGVLSLLPGQETGLAALIYLQQEVKVARIEAGATGGMALAMAPAPGLSGSAAAYLPGDPAIPGSARATGLLANPYARVAPHPLASAVLYNAQGEIIGGGFDRIEFILPNDHTGVSFYAVAGGEVAGAELYGMEEALALPADADPPGVQPPVVRQEGYAAGPRRVNFAALVENPNAGWAMDGGLWQVTVLAADGTVLGAESGVAPLVLPGQTLGVTGFFDVSDAQPVAQIETRVYRNKWTPVEAHPPFAVENVRYEPGQGLARVTGEVANPYDREIKNVWTYAVLYDAAGGIIGGARGSAGPLPAKGKAATEVTLDFDATPARVELYAAASYVSELP